MLLHRHNDHKYSQPANTVSKRWHLYFIALGLSDDSQESIDVCTVKDTLVTSNSNSSKNRHWLHSDVDITSSREGYADNKSCILVTSPLGYKDNTHGEVQFLILSSTNEGIGFHEWDGVVVQVKKMPRKVKYRVSKLISITLEYVRRVKV